MAVTAIYARVSTDEQAEHGTSLDEQVRLCRQQAAGEPVIEFVDAGITGTTMDRPQLNALLEHVRRHDVDRVIVYDPDRLSRNVTHLLLIVDEVRRSGAEMQFVNFQADLSPDGRLLFTVRGAISEFEAHRIKQRMYGGKQARARAGQVASGTSIYGYRLNRVVKQWEEEPREAQVVRLMFEWALEVGTWEITRRLNRQGLPSRFGRLWSQSSVFGILRNPTYTGHMPQMKGLGHVPVPPLISVAQFDRVQRAISRRLNRPAGHSKHPYLLTGRLTCSGCGRSMCGGYGRPVKGGTVTYYVCTSKAKPSPGAKPCTNHFWRSDVLDAKVWDHVLAWIRDPAAYRAAAATQARDEDTFAELCRQQQVLVREGERLKTERDRLIRAFRHGLIGEDDLAQQKKELDAEARMLDQRAQSVQAHIRAATLQAEDIRRAEQTIARIVNDAPGLENTETRRAILAALGVKVTVSPDGEVQIRVGIHD